jgi:hypothetical protein
VNRAAASGDRCRRRGRRGLRHRRADAPGPSRDCVLRCQIKSNGGMHCRAKLGASFSGCVFLFSFSFFLFLLYSLKFFKKTC